MLGVFLLGRLWLGARTAAVAALAAALMPGAFLNALYTWPKQTIAYFVLVALALAWRGRAGRGGRLREPRLPRASGGGVVAARGGVVALAAPGGRERARATLAHVAGAALVVALPWLIFTSSWSRHPRA